MKSIGAVEALWRYPVKSMGGEELTHAYLAKSGLSGDRLYAFHYSGAPANFPYLTARQQPEMLRYEASYDAHADGEKGRVFVVTPDTDRLAIEDESIITLLSRGLPERQSVSLLTSDRAMTDCHPISLLAVQTTRQLSAEVGLNLDKMRFRANVYLNLTSGRGFAEDEFVGKTLLIGSKAVVEVIERDERCKIITLDPATGAADPRIMRHVAEKHERKIGIYGSVLVEGMINTGDDVLLLD